MSLRMMSIGDMLIHMEIVGAAKGDYSMLFQNVKALFDQADIVTCNQETLLTDRIPPSGFPVFATPTAVGHAEMDAGIDLVTCASNHTLDQWRKGMADETAFWKQHPQMTAIGIRERGVPFKPAVLERNGIRLAFLTYTRPMNVHFNLPWSKYYVETLHFYNKPAIAKQIAEAKKVADAVVVLPHWGTEYLYAPTKSQRKWAQFLVDAGADLIIGTHPHVLQPVEEVTAKDGRKVPVFFSLGNFVSAQKRPGTMLGGLADCTWEKTESGAKVSHYELKPLVAATDAEFTAFTVFPLEDYPDSWSNHNRLFRIIEEGFGVKTDKAYLEQLYADIWSGEAQRANPFQTPADVLLYNIYRIWTVIQKRGKK